MTMYHEKRLLKRQIRGNLRELVKLENLIDFSSNDYLGLASSSLLATSIEEEWNTNANLIKRGGASGSRLLTGNSVYTEELEATIAHFHGYPTGLLFSCGYMANLGLLSAIMGDNDTLFFDSEIHASSHDGIRLSRTQAFPFRHNDTLHLENRLKKCTSRGNRYICVESIYSADGSKAPLVEICELAQKYEALLIVDEAHAAGVFGPAGRGLVAENHLTSFVYAQVTTFGKALGTYGAIVLGNSLLKQTLINFARSFIYTTALPFYSLAAIKCSYNLFPLLENQRNHLHQLIGIFREWDSNASETQIQSITVKGNENVKLIAKKLIEEGFDLRPLLSPTVQQGREALRICLHAFNTDNELRSLLKHVELFKGGLK